ncbi:nonribosomal peptide synthetase [Penicillium robsamsonii]|uniref:nonribosomal peptide synthetase n=1 Tax=Penicillium robsamsonii TaxID=1792511 RepID=UPI00254845FB|nr:nonribosomal peptide synthetase [Penicillium robsamsonii]KAJ5816470.1 nonribosomal peptide synthetase [Penicillium robsamsonii]
MQSDSQVVCLHQTGEERQYEAQCLPASRLIPYLYPPANITLATVVKTAWAIVVGELFTSTTNCLGVDYPELRDIIFAQAVNTRGLGFMCEDRMVRASLNVIPVRVRFSQTTPSLDLLHQVQQQHVDAVFAKNMGFAEIRKNCTPWSSDTVLTSYIRYHSFSATPACSLGGVPMQTRIDAPNDLLFEIPDIVVNKVEDGLLFAWTL